ncbi:MAG TPA: hypothetical protein VLE03_02465 [Nitrospiraceae bacterium]|nr:hypothetical protein [Nitrospiraceae bacterium]
MRASDMKRITALTLTITFAGLAGTSFALAEEQGRKQMDTTPGPAYTTIDGQVTKIEGEIYTVQSGYPDSQGGAMTQKEIRMYVGRETKKLKGDKKVGDKIRAELTYGGFANSIQ